MNRRKRMVLNIHNSREQFQVHQPGGNSERVKLIQDGAAPYDPREHVNPGPFQINLRRLLAEHFAAQRPAAEPGPDFAEAHKLDLDRRRLDRKP